MIFNLFILVAILFIGVPGIIEYSFRKKTKMIMQRINPKYTGHVNNSVDFFRIIRAFMKSQEINKEEKRTLGYSIVLVSISWISGIVLIFIMIFFNDQILN